MTHAKRYMPSFSSRAAIPRARRHVPEAFAKMLDKFDRGLELHYDPFRKTWVVYRMNHRGICRGLDSMVKELTLNSRRAPGRWIIQALAGRRSSFLARKGITPETMAEASEAHQRANMMAKVVPVFTEAALMMNAARKGLTSVPMNPEVPDQKRLRKSHGRKFISLPARRGDSND
jgi:hypothetical protein